MRVGDCHIAALTIERLRRMLKHTHTARQPRANAECIKCVRAIIHQFTNSTLSTSALCIHKHRVVDYIHPHNTAISQARHATTLCRDLSSAYFGVSYTVGFSACVRVSVSVCVCLFVPVCSLVTFLFYFGVISFSALTRIFATERAHT